jgi:hypothetical protein
MRLKITAGQVRIRLKITAGQARVGQVKTRPSVDASQPPRRRPSWPLDFTAPLRELGGLGRHSLRLPTSSSLHIKEMPDVDQACE